MPKCTIDVLLILRRSVAALSTFVIGLIILHSDPASAGQNRLHKAVLEHSIEIARLADSIAEFGKGRKSVFVAIGASPLVVAAALRAPSIPSESVCYLPLSNLWDLQRRAISIFDEPTGKRFILAYFDYFLRAALRLNPTRWIFFDYAQTGGSLPLTRRYILYYLNQWTTDSRSTTFIGFGASFVPTKEFDEQWAQSRIAKIDISDSLDHAFSSRQFNECRIQRRREFWDWIRWSATRRDLNEVEFRNELAQTLDLETASARYKLLIRYFRRNRRRLACAGFLHERKPRSHWRVAARGISPDAHKIEFSSDDF